MFSLIVLMSEAFAVVREAARRRLGMRHFDVQVSLLFSSITHRAMQDEKGKEMIVVSHVDQKRKEMIYFFLIIMFGKEKQKT